jgi:23S rRNA (uridine2552-2'-O)-methyltransferase
LAGRGRIIAVDILPMEPVPGVEFIRGDFTENVVLDLLLKRLSGCTVDLVISDMAPTISGVGTTDQARAIELAELVLDFAAKALRPGGNLLLKVFQGEGYPELRRRMQACFGSVLTRKPRASRSESREMYLLGKGFKEA